MGTITVHATRGIYEATSISQGEITFSWDGTRTCGKYVDGPCWVLVPTGNLTLNEPTPAQTTDGGGKTINGAEKNPTSIEKEQAYDQNSSGGWNAARAASFPLSVTAGDVVCKAKSSSSWSSVRDGVIREYAAIFVVSSVPAANSFSPAVYSWAGRTTKDASVVDVATWVSANCPSYDTSGHAEVPQYTEILAQIQDFNPVFPACQVTFYEQLFPSNSSSPFHYGRKFAGIYGAAALALISSSFTTAQKETIVKHLISKGKQWHEAFLGDGYQPEPDGGHHQFHLVPMAIYLHATGQIAALDTLITDVGGNYDQAFFVTADMIANDFVPHDSDEKPYTWRKRTLPAGSVSGTTISGLPALSGDWQKGQFAGLIMTRVGDGATANVTAMVSTTAPYSFTIDAQPGTPFAEGDVIYFETPHPLALNEAEWRIRAGARAGGGDYFSWYGPTPGTEYRNLNEWSGQLLGLKALGCFPADGTAVQAYVEKANAANTPSASFDMPDSLASFGNLWDKSYDWESEFWTDHAATILA